VTVSQSKIFNDTEYRAASLTAELLVKLTIINCHFIILGSMLFIKSGFETV